MKLVGKIKSGYGNAAFWVNKVNNIFEKKYGTKLFLGTLNIELNEPYILDDKEKILPSEYDGEYDVLVQEGELLGHKVYILRPDMNNKEGGSHPLNLIEVVSDICLREFGGFKDKDEVEIKIINKTK